MSGCDGCVYKGGKDCPLTDDHTGDFYCPNGRLSALKKVEFVESYIKIGNADYQWYDNHGELVRCRDCKYKMDYGHCRVAFNGPVPPDDWYCADGVRK